MPDYTHDALGTRMKQNFEDRVRFMLPRRSYVILRLDGKSFHTYTKKAIRPYDLNLMHCMDLAAIALCKEAAGAKFAYLQSDECSILLTDFEKVETAAWFDNNVQKLVSVSSSLFTLHFNDAMRQYGTLLPNAIFDARVFVIPDPIEVDNYFRWRMQDCERNSVTMLAQNYASQKQLHGQNREKQHDIIHEAGDNWNDHPADFKRGRCIVYRDQQWQVDHETPVFTKNPEYLRNMIPRIWEEKNVENAIP